MTEKQFDVVCAALADAIIRRNEIIESKDLDIYLLDHKVENLTNELEAKKNEEN